MGIRILGIGLLVVGLTIVVYSAFNFLSTENVVDLGPRHVSRDRNHLFGWPPIAGLILTAAGIVLFLIGNHNRKPS